MQNFKYCLSKSELEKSAEILQMAVDVLENVEEGEDEDHDEIAPKSKTKRKTMMTTLTLNQS